MYDKFWSYVKYTCDKSINMSLYTMKCNFTLLDGEI